MSLIRRIELVLLLLLSVLAVATFVSYFGIVDSSFEDLERQRQQTELRRVEATIANELVNFSAFVGEWTSWDDTYAFMEDGNQDYIDTNFAGFDYYEMNLFMFVGADNEVRHIVSWDYETGADLAFAKFNNPEWRQSVIFAAQGEDGVAGFVGTEHGLMMVAALDILRSDDSGTPRGKLIAGRIIAGEHLEKLRQISQLPLNLHMSTASSESGSLATSLPALDGVTGYQVSFTLPDDIRQQANVTFISFLGALLLTFIAVWLALRLILASQITRPLEKLTASLAEVTDEKHLPDALPVLRQDEIGKLATAFNEMLARLHANQVFRAASEAALNQQLMNARRTENLARIGSYVWDWKEDRLVRCSEGYAAMRGLSIDQVLAQLSTPAQDLESIHPEDRKQYRDVEFSAIEEKAAGYTVNYRVQLKNGKVIHVREVCEFEYGSDGELLFTHGSSQDVTEYVMMEEQLRHAQKLEAIGQLTGGIAHDFNNLLVVILGNIQMTQQAIAAGKNSDRFINASLKAAQKAATLVERLLAYGQKQPLLTTTFDVRDTVQDMTDSLRQVLGANVTTNIELPDTPCVVDADEIQLESALLNVVINAKHAMASNGHLSITLNHVRLDDKTAEPTPDLQPGKYITVEVTDNGQGMPQEIIEKAFDPFFTTKNVGEGSGLGLSMVYGYCRQLGGTAEISSATGEGTTVKIYLPESAASATSAQQNAGTLSTSRPCSIMVVEDEPEVRNLAVMLLESEGFTTLATENAESAVELLESGTSIDLVFTDIVLTGSMDGLSLARKLNREYPQTAVLLTSGYPRQHNISPEYPFLKKPYSSTQLIRGINETLEKAETQVEAGAKRRG